MYSEVVKSSFYIWYAPKKCLQSYNVQPIILSQEGINTKKILLIGINQGNTIQQDGYFCLVRKRPICLFVIQNFKKPQKAGNFKFEAQT